jgi:predicted DsbA family dithiol-disulfide isomerase
VLADIGARVGVSAKTLQSFRESRAGDQALEGSEERLRGFGVRTVPNLLFGGRVLVPGTVNVATYVHALDQALFPSNEGDDQQKPTLH